MSFAETIYALTGAFGWVIIALAIIALAWIIVGYLRQAHTIVKESGWPELWRQVRVHILTRKPRNRP